MKLTSSRKINMIEFTKILPTCRVLTVVQLNYIEIKSTQAVFNLLFLKVVGA